MRALSLTDKAAVFGTVDGGSIPSGRTMDDRLSFFVKGKQ